MKRAWLVLVAGALAGLAAVNPRADTGMRVRAGQLCGMSYAHTWEEGERVGYGSARSAKTLRQLHDLGVNAVSYTPFGWMRSQRSTRVQWSPDAGESFAGIRADAARAHALGMTVLHKPHLWVGRGAWRGALDPDPASGGWDAWFDSYQAFALAQARLAAQIGAEWYCVGTELESSVKARPERWRALIAAVREVYPGKLTYCANWNDVEQVPFWDALDAIGVQMYAPLAGAPTTDEAVLEQGAAKWLRQYEALSKRVGKPLLITEVGFVNRPDAAVKPYEWSDGGRQPTAAGDAAQAAAYAAIERTFGQSPRVIGIFWWKWFTDPATREEAGVGFPPAGKPAEQILRAACGG